ncbi:Crp/Fnr family transcriptional regulator [Parasphingorhabdus sp.]|uniref:Crp/Fnr family transcriptional regulator n=1 Tax=Parasphingorhabdus sp. TaxID=2709688 RepID=UPI003A8EEE30
MIAIDTVRKLFVLSATKPFDVLTESELLLIAMHAHHRRYASGATIFAAGQVADMLVITLAGEAQVRGERGPAIFDPSSALFGLPVRDAILAGPDGLEALCLAKPHLFTIARECPDFVVGLVALESDDLA